MKIYFLPPLLIIACIPLCHSQIYTNEINVVETGGLVGIGTETPTNKLTVIDDGLDWAGRFQNTNGSDIRLGYKDGQGIYVNTNTTNGLYLMSLNYNSDNIFRVWSNGEVYINGFLDVNTNTDAVLTFNNTDNSWQYMQFKRSGNRKAWMGLNNSDDFCIYKEGGGSIVFDWANVGIGTTSPSYKLHVIGTAAATSFQTTSDIRLKNIFGTINGSDILDKYLDLNLYTFSYKSEDSTGVGTGHYRIGVVAQEVEKVFPELVTTDDQGIKSVDYSALAVTAIAVVKEQQDMISELQKEVEEIKSLLEKNKIQ